MPMSPFAAPSGAPPQQEAAARAIQDRTMGGLGEGRNRLAMLLAQAFQELLTTGFTPDNIAALQQFGLTLRELAGQSAQAPGAVPQGQGAMPGGAPPPAAPLPQG